MKHFRIGVLAPSLGRSGGVRRLLEVASRLRERGHLVTLYTDYPHAAMIRHGCERKEIKYLKQDRNQIVCMGWPRFKKHPWVYEIDARVKLWFQQAFYGREDVRFIQDPSFVKVAFSTHMYNKGIEYGAKPYKAIGGINFEHFYPERVEKESVLYRQRRSPHIEDYSNFDIKEIYQSLGYSDERIKILKKYSALGVNKFYNSGKIFVSSEAHFAGWCNPIVEAMACRAVAVSDWTESADDLIIPGETGFRYKNKEELKEIIQMVMKDTTLRRRIQNNAQEHIKQFDYKYVIDNIEKAILENL